MIHAIGLMSGTSADGVDAAAVETDGRGRVSCGPWLTVPYDAALRTRLRTLDRDDRAAIDDVAAALTDVHAAAVAALSRRLSSPARVIGFHGHTLHHDPARGVTRQIGDAGRLAAACGIDVVADFRSADVAAGGQGAPLAPLYHAALADPFEKPVAILNIGGVANVTYLDREANAIRAFDTGPGNGLLDDWATRHAGAPMDRDGRMAAAGVADTRRLAALMADPYFSRPPPKSLDRDHFAALAARVLEGSAPTDGAATLVAFTAAAAALAGRHFPRLPERWLICGGGRRNPQIMQALGERIDAAVAPVETVGWQGDALEAQAFAYLAVRSLNDLPLSLPQTTGVAAPCQGGRRYPASTGGQPTAASSSVRFST